MRGMDEGLTFSQACELALSALAEVQVRSPGCFANGSVRLWIEVVLPQGSETHNTSNQESLPHPREAPVEKMVEPHSLEGRAPTAQATRGS